MRTKCEAIAAGRKSADREEFMACLVAVAVPMRDGNGLVRAAIAVHAPTARLTTDGALARLPTLHAAAQRMATFR